MKTKQPIKQLLILLFLVGLGMGCEEEIEIPKEIKVGFKYEIIGEPPYGEIRLKTTSENANVHRFTITYPDSSQILKSRDSTVLTTKVPLNMRGNYHIKLKSIDFERRVSKDTSASFFVNSNYELSCLSGETTVDWVLSYQRTYVGIKGKGKENWGIAEFINYYYYDHFLNIVSLADNGKLILSPDDPSARDYEDETHDYVHCFFYKIYGSNPKFKPTIINTEIQPISIAQYDTMNTDYLIKDLEFTHNSQIIYKEDLPKLVFFKDYKGYVGVLKITKIDYFESCLWAGGTYYTFKHPKYALEQIDKEVNKFNFELIN